ncbi:hypothetical protein M0805_004133 [Coniferiporia weirii]|nr:hypothetical protein M0805_004133 [Coniferiporia weirii]
MVKREFAANPDIDVDAPRPKRRKDVQSETPAAEDDEAHDPGASSDQEQEQINGVENEGPAMSPEEVREEGLKVWQALKDAVDKEGRSISYDFLRLPSKRQFPDYYVVIKRPIALDDIKAQLDSFGYASLETLRQDFDQCFKNAKKYNMRESVIWKDAKTLQKLANKEIERIIRRRNDDEGEGEGSDKEGGKKKEKAANITRLMKNRLQKLASKMDENGRLVAADFMDLPSKKKWPVYYKIIKRPICIEDIFKRIKRKEYPTIPDFMNDVELVFANAIQFNEEHSPIWEDATTLKAYFQQLMTDLPAKYNMNGTAEADFPASSEAASNKIMLKLPNHQPSSVTQSGGESAAAQGGDATSGTVRLRVPALSGAGIITFDTPIIAPTEGIDGAQSKKTKTKSPVELPAAPTPSPLPSTPSLTLATPTPQPAKAATPTPVKSPQAGYSQAFATMPAVSAATSYSQYNSNAQIAPQNFYTPPTPQALAPVPATPARTSATPARASATPAPLPGPLSGVAGSSAVGARTDAPAPTPPARAAGLHSMRLETFPTGRRLALLDAGAGVRSWAVRLSTDEKGLVVKDVRFIQNGEGSDEEREVEGAGDVPPPKKRGRGRPRKLVVVEKEVKPVELPVITAPASPSAMKPSLKPEPKIVVPSVEDVLVRLDGLTIAPKPKAETTVEVFGAGDGADAGADMGGLAARPKSARGGGEWAVDITTGQHVLEVGRRGNSIHWKVYVYV